MSIVVPTGCKENFTWYGSYLLLVGYIRPRPYIEKHRIHSSFANQEALIVEDCVDEFVYCRLVNRSKGSELGFRKRSGLFWHGYNPVKVADSKAEVRCKE